MFWWVQFIWLFALDAAQRDRHVDPYIEFLRSRVVFL
jgi:hypothetical protein